MCEFYYYAAIQLYWQRVCTLVLFINTCVWLLEVREVTVTFDFIKKGGSQGSY